MVSEKLYSLHNEFITENALADKLTQIGHQIEYDRKSVTLTIQEDQVNKNEKKLLQMQLVSKLFTELQTVNTTWRLKDMSNQTDTYDSFQIKIIEDYHLVYDIVDRSSYLSIAKKEASKGMKTYNKFSESVNLLAYTPDKIKESLDKFLPLDQKFTPDEIWAAVKELNKALFIKENVGRNKAIGRFNVYRGAKRHPNTNKYVVKQSNPYNYLLTPEHQMKRGLTIKPKKKQKKKIQSTLSRP